MRFAIVGAAEERPDQSPPIDVQKAREAAALIGAALAKRGHGLVVYDAKYIEAEVVSAYVAAEPKMPERGSPIVVRQSPTPTNIRFKEEQSNPAMFDRVFDPSAQWAKRRYAVESGPIVRHAVIAAVLFVLALVFAFGGQLVPGKPDWAWPVAVLFVGTLLAGVAGAAVRMVFKRRYGSGPLVPPSMAVTIALGLMAGAPAGMLYIVAQPGDIKVSTDTAGLRLVSLVLVVATVGGLTAEAIFRKLLGIDVLRTSGLPATADSSGK